MTQLDRCPEDIIREQQEDEMNWGRKGPVCREVYNLACAERDHLASEVARLKAEVARLQLDNQIYRDGYARAKEDYRKLIEDVGW